MIMKKILRPSNVILIVLLMVVVFTRVPQILEHTKLEGTKIPDEERRVLTNEELVRFPPSSGHALVIYWATWCAPCKLEMNRLRSSVESGALPKDRVFAVSLFEDEKVIKDFLEKNPYPFIFLAASKSDEALSIRATPTTLIIQDGKIRSLSQGMSLFGIWWAAYLLRDK